MHTYHAQRRSFLKKTSGLALAPAWTVIPNFVYAANSELVVGTWGGDYQNLLQQFIAPLLKRQGVDVIYETANATARGTKLKAERNSRRSSMDVAFQGDTDMYDASIAGALDSISQKNIPNLDNVIESFKKPYSIPHIFSAIVIVYNTEKIPTPPKSFSETLDPKYQGRIGFSDILFNANTLFAGLAEGGDTSSFAPGMRFLRKLKSNQPKVFPSNEAVAAAFKSGEIWISCMWKARALQWRDAGLPLGFVIPEEGALPVTFEAAVPKNSRNKENAWKYLNALLEPAGQIQFAKHMGYAPTIRNAQMPADLQARVGFSEAELARIHPINTEVLISQRSTNLDFWNKEFKMGL